VAWSLRQGDDRQLGVGIHRSYFLFRFLLDEQSFGVNALVAKRRVPTRAGAESNRVINRCSSRGPTRIR
jgi:hypothetical protein